MICWNKGLHSVFHQVGRRSGPTFTRHSSYSISCWASCPSLAGSLRLHAPSPRVTSRPPFLYLQQWGISSSRFLRDSNGAAPVPSPLAPISARKEKDDWKYEIIPKPAIVEAVIKRIKQSPRKVALVAGLVRGMRVEDALLQMQVLIKRAAKAVRLGLLAARANASHNFGLNPDKLMIDEAFVGKGVYLKRISYHAKGRSGIREKKQCRLTIRVRELTPDEETTIAKIKVGRARKPTKKEKRLVPHTLIERSPLWDRKVRKQHGMKVI